MKKLKLRTSSLLFTILMFFFSSLFLTACKTERIAILKDIPDSTSIRYIPLAKYSSPVVRVDDILNIVIQTLDPQANTILNQGNLPATSGAVAGNNSTAQAVVSGYLVSKDGIIHMPYIGSVLVKGLTTEQMRDTIAQKMAFYF